MSVQPYRMPGQPLAATEAPPPVELVLATVGRATVRCFTGVSVLDDDGALPESLEPSLLSNGGLRVCDAIRATDSRDAQAVDVGADESSDDVALTITISTKVRK